MHNVGEYCGREFHGEHNEQQETELEGDSGRRRETNIYVTNDKELIREWFSLWFTYNVDQHGALFDRSDYSRNSDNHQTDWNDYHESCWSKKVIIHKDTEVFENRWDGWADGHQ